MITVIAPDDVWIPALGRSFSKGDLVEAPDEIGANLVAQGWKKHAVTNAPKADSVSDRPATEPKEG